MKCTKKIVGAVVRSGIIILLALAPLFSHAQKMTFVKADSLTYALYLSGQWDSLIVVGNQALDDGFDYFYLRERIAMAYFNKDKFRLAASQFEKAVGFNSSDTFALRHLYLCYLYSGRDADAWMLTGKFNTDLRASLGIEKNVFVNGLYAEGGYIFSNSLKKYAGADFDDLANLYGEVDLTGSYSYVHLGLKHPITKFLNIYHAYSNLSIEKEKIMQHRDTSRKEDFYMLQQNQYYIQATINLNRKWLIVPAFHYLNVRYSPLYASFDTISGYVYTQEHQKLNDFAAFLGISKDFGYTSLGISGSLSQLNSKTYIQANATLNIFPLGNLNLYSLTTLSGVLERDSAGTKDAGQPGKGKPRIIFSETIGGKIFRKLYAEAGLTYGDISGYNEKNAFVVNNIPDHTKYRAGMSLIYNLSPHIDLGVYYLYTEKEGSYFFYNTINSVVYKNYNYQINTITGGVKWKL
ncbi:MAG: hypothetical protein WCM76_01330 [Bacteroidota bacterium]